MSRRTLEAVRRTLVLSALVSLTVAGDVSGPARRLLLVGAATLSNPD
jgi:hypothetical protein